MSDPQHPEGPVAGEPGSAGAAGLTAEQAEVAAALEAAATAPALPPEVAAGAVAAVSEVATGLSGAAAGHVAGLSSAAEASVAGGTGGAAGTGGAGGGGGTAGTWTAVLFAVAATLAVATWLVAGLRDQPVAAPEGESGVAAATSSPEPSGPVPQPSSAQTSPRQATTPVPTPAPRPSPGVGDPPPPEPLGPSGPDAIVPPVPTDGATVPPVLAPSTAPTTPATPPPAPGPSPPDPAGPSPTPTASPTVAPSPTPSPTPSPSSQPGTVLLRVNAGGPTLPARDGPNWRADRGTSSGDLRPESPDGSAPTTWPVVATLDPVVPPTTPPTLYDSDRHHPGSTDPWEWDLPVPGTPRDVLVRVYLAERDPMVGPADRLFTLVVEDEVVAPEIDLRTHPGLDIGTLVSVVVPSSERSEDGILDVDFVRVAGDPVVSGFELVELDGP